MKKKYKKRKNRTEKITIAVLSLMIIGGGCYIGGNYIINSKSESIETIPDDEEVSIINQGITIKKLNTVTNHDGSVTKTFDYKIEPANATNKSVTLSAKYIDGNDCSSIVTLDSDESKQTISITCKADFDKVINVTVVSDDNLSVKSIITLNYVKKLKSFNSKSEDNYRIYFGSGFNASGDSEYQFDNMSIRLSDLITNCFDVTYTKFTKDQTFNFLLEDVNVTLDEVYYNVDSFPEQYKNLVSDYYKKLLDDYLKGKKNDDFSGLSEAIWNLSSDNLYHSILVEESNYSITESYVSLSFNSDVYYNNGNDKGNHILNTNFGGLIQFPLSFDYSGKKVGVDSLTPDISNIDF